MSITRTGKKQSAETIAKRIRTIKEKLKDKPIASIVKEVKNYMNHELKWSRKIYERDEWKCTNCSSSIRLDVHHINPIVKIIKRLLKDKPELTDNKSKFDYLIAMDEILDKNLENGKVLCRKCHREIHGKTWGSHTQIAS